MDSLISEMWNFVAPKSGTLFDDYHHSIHPDTGGHLEKFLFASMDEVRLWHANLYSKKILKELDLDDADHFRQGLMRREIAGDIAYPKQRDHSAHTLNNYLLGWYVYSNSEAIRNAFASQFELRGLNVNRVDDIIFRSVWPLVSLLHDIGYLFEGKIDPFAAGFQSAQISIGADVAQEYFHHRFWIECSADSMHDRERLRALALISEPDFSNRSVTGVADTLRSLGDLEALRAAIIVERDTLKIVGKGKDYLSQPLPGDAFDLWERHYDYFGSSSMADRVKDLRRAFDSLLRDGLGHTGLRLLDHGICSGLLSLHYSTFYFRVYFGLGQNPPANEQDREIWLRFREASGIKYPADPAAPTYESYWCWAGILWATAATAMHNLQQFGDAWPVGCANLGPLRLDEDPLAYLGILVDCLQEWDRYTVSRESVIGGVLPLQGIDVSLGTDNGSIVIDYHDKARAESAIKGLNKSLADWKQIVGIEAT